MLRFQGAEPVPDNAKGAAVALGNFDGVHAGHRAVIASARRRGGLLAVASFEPHPRRFFNPDAPPFRLQTPNQRARALESVGVGAVYELKFDQDLVNMTDRDFAEQVLGGRLGARHVSVGEGFRFGQGRMGDVESLTRLGAEFGFSVDAIAPVQLGGIRISSTAVREAIAAGAVDQAAMMLGRPWAIEGDVERGFERGRTLGFPTANVALSDYVRPRLGVYAVRARVSDAVHDGVASIGVNPTTGALPAPLLEAHLFGFDGDLYGQTIEVALRAFLREEAKFDDVEDLKTQMTRDAEAGRAALARLP